GQGIPEAEIPMLFDRFFRSQDTRRTEQRGSGLGLAIVKSIIDAHNGRIEVFSKLGVGSTFRVWLPMAGAATETARPVAEGSLGAVRKLLPLPQRVVKSHD